MATAGELDAVRVEDIKLVVVDPAMVAWDLAALVKAAEDPVTVEMDLQGLVLSLYPGYS